MTSYEQKEDEEEFPDHIEYYSRRKNHEKKPSDVLYGKAILDGELFENYLHDISIVREFASINRKAIVDTIKGGMGLHEVDRFSNVHNYVDTERMILRKGAVSANLGERVVIPLNMRDGVLICTGLGNPQWNFSAPHGAGRVCSRTEAKHTYSVEEYQKQMEGVYTTTANANSIDECPMVYKAPEHIINMIGESVRIDKIVKPIYNFKAC